MKQSTEFMQSTHLKCRRHPQTIVSSVCTNEKSIYESRLACMKCCKEYQKWNEFEDISESNAQFAEVMRLKFNSLPITYLTSTNQDRLELVDQLIVDVNQLLNDFRENLVKQFEAQHEYTKLTNTLRQQFDKELQQLQDQIYKTGQTDNYHSTEEWTTLEKQLNDFIQLYYNPNNQEIKETLSKITYIINDFKEIQYNAQLSNQISALITNLEYQLQQCYISPNKATMVSTLMNGDFLSNIMNRINPASRCTLLFKGTRDGMNQKAFWKQCGGWSKTLMICKSESGTVFGGYTPSQWVQDRNGSYEDLSLKSFIFNFTRQEIYPLRHSHKAIYCDNQFGPTFGDGHELQINANFKDGYSRLNQTTYSTEGYIVEDARTHLMGGATPLLVEMEVYSVQ